MQTGYRRAQVYSQFNLRPTQENLSKFKIARAKARRTIKQSKRASWRQYVSRLNSRSSVKKTWDMIKKINGKNSSLNVGHVYECWYRCRHFQSRYHRSSI